MKNFKFLTVFIFLFSLSSSSLVAQGNADEKLNLPGDNLNLYAVLKLFQESETLEGFERNLNAEDSKINNLDLNNDDQIDYIRVNDFVDRDVHTIVMQVAVNANENQDVAVFTVQKDDKGQVQIQLIGDEELYGKDYIIEPNYSDAQTASETPNPGYTGNTQTYNNEPVEVTRTTYVEVATWPVVRYIYLPTYSLWHSPWYWGYYPSYWQPWRPYYWDYYYGYHSNWHWHYYGHYRHWHHYRYANWNNNYYHGHRVYSTTVRNYREAGKYTNTYSRPDLRKEGTAEYRKRYPNDNRPTRESNGGNVNRRDDQQGTGNNSSRNSARPADNKPANRQDVNKPSGRGGNTKQDNRRDVNKPSERREKATPSSNPGRNNSGVNRSSGRPAKNPSSVKSGSSNRPSGTKSNSKSERKSSPSGKSKSGEKKPSGR